MGLIDGHGNPVTEEEMDARMYPLKHLSLSKRDLFAAMAMQAVLNAHGEDYESIIAERAVKYADALIKELNKQK